jgi:hypothetical protein
MAPTIACQMAGVTIPRQTFQGIRGLLQSLTDCDRPQSQISG